MFSFYCKMSSKNWSVSRGFSICFAEMHKNARIDYHYALIFLFVKAIESLGITAYL